MASILAQQTLSGATASGAGTTIDFLDARTNVAMVVAPSGTITGGLVAMQASQNGTTWVTLYTFDPTIAANQFYAASGAFRFWRANILVALTGGGTVSATLMEADR